MGKTANLTEVTGDRLKHRAASYEKVILFLKVATKNMKSRRTSRESAACASELHSTRVVGKGKGENRG